MHLTEGRLDSLFHALADPGRRGMVERLSRGPATVSELAKPLDMTLSAVGQHVAVLQRCGLVRTEKVGRVRRCHLEPGAVREVEQWLADRRATWERKLDRLGAYLAATEPEAAQDSRPTQTTDGITETEDPT